MSQALKAMPIPDHPTADILAEAARCFQDRGYEATSIDEVARGVGATKGRIYYHFRSKADLLAAVFRTGMQVLRAEVLPICELDLPAAEKLERMARAHTTTLIRTRPFQRVVWQGVHMQMREASSPDQRQVLDELAAARDEYAELFRPVIMQAREDGVLSYDSTSIALQLFLMSLNSPVIWYSPRQGETGADIDRLTNQIVGYAMAGLGRREMT